MANRRSDSREFPMAGNESVFLNALGESEEFLEFQERLSAAAKVDRPLLLIGERGTGKELAAHRVHSVSNRWSGPLVTLNCAALSPTLIEAELFGHEEGAFTGAGKRRKGRFELAHGGTLFLDEIGNIPMQAQEKLLRVVEYGTFERVGGSEPVSADVRIVGATHANLPKLAERGEFKADLLDRLSFEVLCLPPLRERTDDILLLANHFASRMAFELGRQSIPEFSDEAVRELEAYPWPGNIRELKNVVERAVYRSDQDLIEKIVFDPFSESSGSLLSGDTGACGESEAPDSAPRRLQPGQSYETAIRDLEVSLLVEALDECKHNQKKAAHLLGMTYHQFRWLYQKHKDSLDEK
jgi:psp operon transcriptional activator